MLVNYDKALEDARAAIKLDDNFVKVSWVHILNQQTVKSQSRSHHKKIKKTFCSFLRTSYGI